MALAGVLSALREIILDDLALPIEPSEREKYLREKFPSLKNEELIDLAKVEPSSFKVYTKTIFAGQSNVLVKHFPVSFALIERAHTRLGIETPSRFKLVQELHSVRPWTTNTTFGLAKNFVEYIREDRTDWLKVVPELADMAQLERLTLKVRRAKDSQFALSDTTELRQLLQSTVSELLSAGFVVPPSSAFESFGYDVITQRLGYYKNSSKLLNSDAERRVTKAVAGRNRALSVRWMELTPAIAEHLSGLEKLTEYTLAQFAEIFVDDFSASNTDSSEEATFQSFLKLLNDLNTLGVLHISAKAIGE